MIFLYVKGFKLNHENDVKFNTKIKTYKNGLQQKVYCTDYIFKSRFDVSLESENIKEFEMQLEHDKLVKSFQENNVAESNTKNIIDFLSERDENSDSEKIFDSHTYSNGQRTDNIKRAKEKVFDIAMQNEWKYFFTLTISPDSFDRTDIDLFKKKLRNWLNNMSKRHGFLYLLVPEYHKDGVSLHAHGLCNDCGIDFVDSGHKTKDGKIIYNMANWKYGFSTAIPLDDNKIAVSKYITKYITKGSNKIFGRYYWASNKCDRVVDTVLCNTVFDDLDLVQYGAFKYDTDFNFSKGGDS